MKNYSEWQLEQADFGIPWKWCQEIDKALTKYFKKNKHRYPDMLTFKESIHAHAMQGKRSKKHENQLQS